jgi:DNA-binding NarL/FixJ family response regulator
MIVNVKEEKVKLLLVDDHQLYIDGIRSQLSKEPHIDIVGEALNGQAAMDFLDENAVDIVLSDMSMPQMTGIELTKKIKQRHPKTQVIVLSMNKRKALIQDAMHSGASGYVLKDATKDELAEAVRSVTSGDTYLSRGVGKILLSMNQKLQPNEDLASLTDRELEILKLISSELSNAEIAQNLDISRRTVETHRKNIMKKLGVKNSVGLARYAFSHGLMD